MIARMFAAPTTRRTRRAMLLVFAGVVAISGCTASEADERAEELAELRRERSALIQSFGITQNAIKRTQGAALDHPGVRAAQDSFYAELRRFAETEDPAVVELLDRSLEIGADLERMSLQEPVLTGEPVTIEQQQAVAGELQAIERALRPHLERAMADPSVRVAFAALQDSLVEQMARLDQNAPRTIERMEDTAERIRQIDIRIAELERGPGP